MSGNVKIDVLDDGPLLVDNLNTLTNSKGEVLEVDDKIALCRCGQSSNKPFCDGTHKKVGFSGLRESDAPLTKERSYEGKEITVHDNRTICSHAAECVSNLSPVFDLNARPWINPDNATAEEVMDVIKKCPSGALSYSVNDVHTRDFEREPEINITRNGPYYAVGSIELNVPGDLNPPSNEHYSLCRCGASKNKPYCDGSHREVDFKDDNN